MNIQKLGDEITKALDELHLDKQWDAVSDFMYGPKWPDLHLQSGTVITQEDYDDIFDKGYEAACSIIAKILEKHGWDINK